MEMKIFGDLFFYLFSVLAVTLAVSSVVTPLILRGVVYLMGVLVLTACFYLLLGAEFLAGIQMLVYVGGIVVLLVFAVMLTHSQELSLERSEIKSRCMAGSAAAAFFLISVWAAWSTALPAHSSAPVLDAPIEEIGRKLLDFGSQGYVLPFEVISILLLASVIGGIVIARRTASDPTELVEGKGA